MQYMNWKDVAEFVGIAAIVASLVFVGLQLRQSQEIAIAAASQNRTAIAVELVATIASDPVLRSAMTKQQSGQAESMTADERTAHAAIAYANLVLFEDTHLQYRNGFVSEEKWVGTRRNLKSGLWDYQGGPMLREVYESTASNWSPPFSELVDELIGEIEDEGLR